MPQTFSQFIGLVGFFLIAGLLIHSLWQAGLRRPPRIDREPCGVSGVLLVVGACMFLAGLYDAAAAALAWQNAQSAAAQTETRGVFLSAAALNAAASLLFFAGALRLFLGRSPSVRLEASAALVAAGPVSEAIGAALLGMPLGVDGGAWFFGLVLFTAFGVWACGFSARARNTYGRASDRL